MKIQLSLAILFTEMIERPKKRLGEILVEEGVLTRENLEEALAQQKAQGGLIGQVLISLGYVTEEEVIAALSTQLSIPYLPLNNYNINMEAARSFNETFCRENGLVAFDQDEERIFITLSDPLNEQAVDETLSQVKLKPQIFLSTRTEITNMIDVVFSQKSEGENGPNSGS